MSNKVKVTAVNGNVVIPSSNNPKYGYVRVESVEMQLENGWVRQSKRSALLRGEVDVLSQLGFSEGQTLPGKIVLKETTTPLNANDLTQGIKQAGETGVACKVGDQPIYREAFYTTNMDATDVLLAHTNGEEIKAAQAAQGVGIKTKTSVFDQE